MDDQTNTPVHCILDSIPSLCSDRDQEEDDAHYEHELSGDETWTTNYRQATFYCALIMLCCCVIGVVGNVVSVLIFTRRSMRSSPINVLLTALSIVDCWVLLAAAAVFVFPGLNIYFQLVEPRALYKTVLASFYQLGMIAQTCSVWTFVLISLERYLAVVHPLRVQNLLSVKRTLMAEVIAVVSAFLYNIPRFFEYQSDEVYGYVESLRNDARYFAVYYATLYLLTHFLFPFFTIAALNAFIFRAIQRAKRGRQTLTEGCQGNKALSANCRRTTRMVVIVTLIFGTCNVLPFVLNIWEALEPDLFKGERKPAAYLTLDVSNVLVVFNSSTTFVIYYFYCQRYRVLLKEGAQKCFCTRVSAEPECRAEPSSTSPTGMSRASTNQQLNRKCTLTMSRSYCNESNVEMSEFAGLSTPLLPGQKRHSVCTQ